MKCKHIRPRRRRYCTVAASLFHPSHSLSRSLSLSLFQSVHRPRNLIKPRLPAGPLAENQRAFTRQIKRTTASGYFYTANSTSYTYIYIIRTLHHIIFLIMFGFDWFAWVYVCKLYIWIVLFAHYETYLLEQKVIRRATVLHCIHIHIYAFI